MMSTDPYPGYEGEYFSMPHRSVVPKPSAAATSAHLGSLFQPRDHQACSTAWDRRPDICFRRRRRSQTLGGRVLRHVQVGMPSHWPGSQSEHRDRHGVHVSRGQRHRRGPWPRRVPVLRVRPQPLLPDWDTRAGKFRHLGRLRGQWTEGTRHRRAALATRTRFETRCASTKRPE